MSYRRYFIPLKPDSNGFGAGGKEPLGRCILEDKGPSGKLSLWAQDLKAESRYKVVLITSEMGKYTGMALGPLHVDGKGKAEFKNEFDSSAVAGGQGLSRVSAVAVMVGNGGEIVSPLVGYKDDVPVHWKNQFSIPDGKTAKNTRLAFMRTGGGEQLALDGAAVRQVPAVGAPTHSGPVDMDAGHRIENPTENIEVGNIEPTHVYHGNIEADNIEPASGNIETGNTEPALGNIETGNTEPALGNIEAGNTEPALGNVEAGNTELPFGNIGVGNMEPASEGIEVGVHETKPLPEVRHIAIEPDNLEGGISAYPQDQIYSLDALGYSKEVGAIEENPFSFYENCMEPHEYANIDDFFVGLTEYTPQQIDNFHEKTDKIFDQLSNDVRQLKEEKAPHVDEVSYDVLSDLTSIFHTNIEITPFDKQSGDTKWVRVSLREPIYLPIDYRNLMNHPLIISAYKKYNHLIMGRLSNNDKPEYVLGLPGIYEPQYLGVAQQLGFTQFKTVAENGALHPGDYGYWLLPIGALD